MRRLAAVSGLALLLAAAGSQAGVTVAYGDPDRFTDAGDRANDPVKVMESLAGHLKQLGERFLAPGTNVRIEVLDVDLAGRPRMNLPTEIRILNGKADMPCIDMRYSVETNGQSSGPRRERLCDPDYLRAMPPKYKANQSLVYEKRMLEEWFRTRFSSGG
jgi:hypothetical protein